VSTVRICYVDAIVALFDIRALFGIQLKVHNTV
jgi:hypothetical protein